MSIQNFEVESEYNRLMGQLDRLKQRDARWYPEVDRILESVVDGLQQANRQILIAEQHWVIERAAQQSKEAQERLVELEDES